MLKVILYAFVQLYFWTIHFIFMRIQWGENILDGR
jgi:hypothetical protein